MGYNYKPGSKPALEIDDAEMSGPAGSGIHPGWYCDLDPVGQADVQSFCQEAGQPPGDPRVIANMTSMFNIDEEKAKEIIVMYHKGNLEGTPRRRLKSILK